MHLIIQNRKLESPIADILKLLQGQLHNGKLKDILPENNYNIAVTCPIHKNGQERHPSCNVYCNQDDPNLEYGKVHCFTCGYSASLPEFISHCFGIHDKDFGERWLLENFITSSASTIQLLPEINLSKKVKSKKVVDTKLLSSYEYYNDYMWKRNLSRNIIDKFQIGYDDKTKMISFPIWDEYDNLVMITYRSVIDKRFHIDKEKDKPVYLLNFIKKENIQKVYVVESQINALTLWSWGYPAIALIGTGSYSQYEILNRSHIRNYILCFDGDEAGDKGISRFIKNMRKDVLISVKSIPRGKDVNDLSKEDFDNLNTYFS